MGQLCGCHRITERDAKEIKSYINFGLSHTTSNPVLRNSVDDLVLNDLLKKGNYVRSSDVNNISGAYVGGAAGKTAEEFTRLGVDVRIAESLLMTTTSNYNALKGLSIGHHDNGDTYLDLSSHFSDPNDTSLLSLGEANLINELKHLKDCHFSIQMEDWLMENVDPNILIKYLRKQKLMTTTLTREMHRCRDRRELSQYLTKVVIRYRQSIESSTGCYCSPNTDAETPSSGVSSFQTTSDSRSPMDTSVHTDWLNYSYAASDVDSLDLSSCNSRLTIRSRTKDLNRTHDIVVALRDVMLFSRKYKKMVEFLSAIMSLLRYREAVLSAESKLQYSEVDNVILGDHHLNLTNSDLMLELIQLEDAVDTVSESQLFSQSRMCSDNASPADSLTLFRFPLLSITFYQCSMTTNSWLDFSKLVRKYQFIKRLAIIKTEVSPSSMSYICEIVRHSEVLTDLDIRLISLELASVESLSSTLSDNRTLREISVASCGLASTAITLLIEGLKLHPYYFSFDISFNEADVTACSGIGAHLEENIMLISLRLRSCSITSSGASEIFKKIKKNSHLAELDLSSNTIGSECIKHLTETLIFNRSLRDLQLDDCGITRSGCYTLARALKSNSTLRSLSLNLNPVRDAGAEHLAEGLIFNRNLTSLSLNLCEIGNHGFSGLLRALMNNSSLRTLKLCYNYIGMFDRRQSDLLTTERLDGNSLVVGSCSIDEELSPVYEKLRQVLRRNKELRIVLWGNQFDICPMSSPDAENFPPPRNTSKLFTDLR